MERKADLENNLPLLLSAKTGGDEGHTCFHLKELFAILVRVLEMNAKTHVRRRTLVFSQSVRKQNVMNNICGRIIHGHNFSNDKRPITVAFVNLTFTIRGEIQRPVKGMPRELQKHRQELHLIYEDYTTKLCRCCQKVLQSMYDQDKQAIHAV